jgi:hypothetical protein
MFKSDSPQNQELDRIAKLVLKAASASESDIEAASSSPFLFTRIRASINEGPEPDSRGWLSLIQVAWRAVPAMALVAIMAAGLTVWSTQTAPVPLAQADDEPLIGALDPGVERTVLASRNGPSREEVFNIIVERNYEANSK